MRQAGYLAQACDYALDNNIDRLKEDHTRARKLGEIMSKHPDVLSVTPVETNIVIFELQDGLASGDYAQKMKEAGILAVPFGSTQIRLVTHLDFDDTSLKAFALAIEKVKS